jgi:glycosyltransferase involved in cell wall biosynthesis
MDVMTQSFSSRKVPHLTFIVTEDWFFASHFLPMARAAIELGFEVSVITRVNAHVAPIEAVGARVIALQSNRKSLNPLTIWRSWRQLSALLKELQPTLIHCIALRSILLGGFAARRSGISRRIYALTGLGLLGARRDKRARCAQTLIRFVIRRLLDTPQTRYLFENPDDPLWLGLDPEDRKKVIIVGGAGVNPDQLTPGPLPGSPPIRIALVARMLWSKGVDLAVQAVSQARAEGAPVSLSLYGAPDPLNPRAIPENVLVSWGQRPGITWEGKTQDVGAVWRDHHLAILPSRGGEGLPRTLLEAASCGRAIITTDVAGCRSFVREGIDGFVAAPDNADALKDAILRFVQQPELLSRMGGAARRRIFSGYTEREVMHTIKRLYMVSLNDTLSYVASPTVKEDRT